MCEGESERERERENACCCWVETLHLVSCFFHKSILFVSFYVGGELKIACD